LAEVPGIQAKFKNEQGVVDRPQGIMVYTDRPGNYVIELRELRAEAERLKKEGKFNEEEYQKKIKELKEKYKPWTVLGLFQFLPDGFGNIRTCIEDWNLKLATKDQCKIKTGSKEQVSLALLSPAQTFNSYCGVGKIAHANYSQINTSSPNGTDFHNILAGGTLKAPKDRCISLLSRAGTGRVYSHYGPLRNSVKDNLGKVMKCVAGALKLRGLWKQGDASVIVEEQNRRPQSEVDSAVLPKSAH
jgi:hypothetical protein